MSELNGFQERCEKPKSFKSNASKVLIFVDWQLKPGQGISVILLCHQRKMKYF